MTAVVAATLIWALLMWMILRGRYGQSQASWARAIAFEPTEAMSADQLFCCLLSGNFALLMQDNFNQLDSSLSKGRVARILAQHWAIHSATDFHGVLETRLARMGEMSPSEKRAVAAWLMGAQADSNEYAALEQTCMFVALQARIAAVDELQHSHLGVLAWDIQQAAYLVRLGLAAGFVSRDLAEWVLDSLRTRARSRYASWKDFSLSALIGLGMRGSLEIFDSTEWTRFARTHTVLLDQHRSPIRSAASWRDTAVRQVESGPRCPLQAAQLAA
jgi:hypothetical protein